MSLILWILLSKLNNPVIAGEGRERLARCECLDWSSNAPPAVTQGLVIAALASWTMPGQDTGTIAVIVICEIAFTYRGVTGIGN